MEWIKKGINYWENPECPREYLEGALVDLVSGVEGISLEESDVEKLNDQELRLKVSRYEYLADK